MVAERALEIPFSSEEVNSLSPAQLGRHLEVASHDRQETEVVHRRPRVSRRLGGSVDYTLEIPQEHLNGKLVNVNVNGICASERMYGPVRDAGAQLGDISVSLGAHQGLPIFDLLSPRGVIDTERYREQMVNAALDDIQDLLGDDIMFNLFGHSTGARTITAVAEKSPERIKSLVFANGAALEEDQHTDDYAGRLKAFNNEEVVPNFDLLTRYFGNRHAVMQLFWYNLGNPLRTGIEALSISNADVRHRIRALALGDSGIKMAVLDGFSDRLTPNKSVRNDLGQIIPYYVHPNMEIGHMGQQIHPFEMGREYHRIAAELNPGEVQLARVFSLHAMERKIRPHHRPQLTLAEAS